MVSFALGCPAGSVVVASVELGCSRTVVVVSSVEVLSLEVGLSSEPRFKSPPSVVVDSVELAEEEDEVEFEAPLPALEVSAATLAGPVVDDVNCEGGLVCPSVAVLSVFSLEG